MEVNSLSRLLLNWLRGPEQKIQPRPGEKGAPPRAAQSDRRELSNLVAALQEAERLEEKGGQADLARLKRLEEEINSGVYEVDPRKLAEAMLRSAAKPSSGEDK
ncbi:MAG: flagellar biosynthesis anti-sigma factor FlgM [Bacillota bacterium]|jgi:flagellar biosynthesis anti-sigma factor FlgM|nr:flagellar biosynthesis anti-sigma factor FlgM [Bacillota bacterium]